MEMVTGAAVVAVSLVAKESSIRKTLGLLLFTLSPKQMVTAGDSAISCQDLRTVPDGHLMCRTAEDIADRASKASECASQGKSTEVATLLSADISQQASEKIASHGAQYTSWAYGESTEYELRDAANRTGGIIFGDKDYIYISKMLYLEGQPKETLEKLVASFLAEGAPMNIRVGKNEIDYTDGMRSLSPDAFTTKGACLRAECWASDKKGAIATDIKEQLIPYEDFIKLASQGKIDPSTFDEDNICKYAYYLWTAKEGSPVHMLGVRTPQEIAKECDNPCTQKANDEQSSISSTANNSTSSALTGSTTRQEYLATEAPTEKPGDQENIASDAARAARTGVALAALAIEV